MVSPDMRVGQRLGSLTHSDPDVSTTSDRGSRLAATADNLGLDAATMGNFTRRVILDALIEGDAVNADRRAAQFEAVGNHDCDLVALALRRKAFLVRNPNPATWSLR